MAKEQEQPLNPEKISGLCGRLLCCLSYEHEGYKEMRRSLPKIGQRCSTPTGEGKVVALNVLRRQVTIRVGNERIEVGPAELGLVVRWDPSRRDAEPPASLSREEAIAQGLLDPSVEEEVPPPPEAVAESWFVSTESVAANAASEQKNRRGRRKGRPSGQPEARSGQGRPRGKGAGQRRSGGGRSRQPQNLPEGRAFKRSTDDVVPGGERERPSPPEPKPKEAGSSGGSGRRRRRRRGRGSGGNSES